MTVSLPFLPAIDAIGRADLPETLLHQLGLAVGAEHCVLFRFGQAEVDVLGCASGDGSDRAQLNSARYRRDFWQADSTYLGLKNSLCGYGAAVSCLAAEQIDDLPFRRQLIDQQGLAGRALIVGERGGRLYGLSMFRRHAAGFFTADQHVAIGSMADLLVSVVAKHDEALSQRTQVMQMLSSVDRLEKAFASTGAHLTERECQVCARIVYGLSMKEIARDLGISPDSAVTYRKRAFLRLDVGDRAALLRRLLQ